MKSDPTVIKHLNKALANELIAINQYFLHSRMFEDWGLQKLAEKEYEESIDEMKHADALIKRILFLEGLANLQNLGRLLIGENTREILNATSSSKCRPARICARASHIASRSGTMSAGICSAESSITRKNTSTGWKPSLV